MAFPYQLADVQFASFLHAGRARVAQMGIVRPNNRPGALTSTFKMLNQAVQRIHHVGIAQSLTSTSIFAQYMVLGCLVIIATTMMLRFLEYVVFKLKL